MNVRDSEVVKGLLAAEGYELVDDAKDADVVLFNTCSVRDHAEQRVWSGVGVLSRKKHRPLIGIIGCMAQNYQGEIKKRAPAVDIVVGPSEIDNIALYLEKALRGKSAVLAVSEKPRSDKIYHAGFYEQKDHAYVVISEGCDNYCSYCVVPYVRGRLRHRASEDILKEVKAAIGGGIRNITLLGQNVNSYQSPDTSHQTPVDFVDLMNKVTALEGLKSLSFVTSHPKDTKRELFELMARQPVIKRYLHLPVQSGSDKILKAMNRGYTAAQYRGIIEEYRSLVYNGKVSTDVIVGFPGESDDDFSATQELMREIRFDSAYIFKYSPRPHTAALRLKDDVPQAKKIERHAVMLELQRKISKENKDGTQ